MTILELKNVSKISSSAILRIFFVIIHIVFGFDFGFIKYKSTSHKIIIKLTFALLALIARVVFILLILPDVGFIAKIWYIILTAECYFDIVALLLTSEEVTFQAFLKQLLWIDSELQLDISSYFLEIKILVGCIISVAIEICLGIDNATYLSILYEQILYFHIFLFRRIPFVVLFFIFRATNIRLAAIRKITNNEPKKAQILYKFLIESVENVKQPFKYIVFVTLLCNIPSAMSLMYEIAKYSKTMGLENLYTYIRNALTASNFLLSLFAPALAAGTLTTEVEKIKITLQDSLILESDENRVQDIQRFIRYIEVRPLKLYVLRIIPLDASLIVMCLKFTTTYLIVILQLTHIY